MPKRQNRKKIDSEHLQGEDSYIIMTSPKVKDMDAHRKTLKPIQAQLNILEKNDDEKSLEYIELKEKLEMIGRQLITENLKEWNWVDDDDNPLPQPHEDGALDLLELVELQWLSSQFSINVSEKKE